ncbi:MAG: glycosyltransferase family 1 protein [Sphaerobacteraceae bacterium]|nr:MAG: glycosyltransferase family 1 protein [Sphaerobacteraceae bacterium]
MLTLIPARMADPMRQLTDILMVHTYYQERGGEDLSFEAERRALEHAGVTVHTYVDTNYRVDTLGGLKAGIRCVWSGEAKSDIQRIIRETRPQLMHVQNSFPMMSPSIYYAARAEGVPVIQSIRNYRLLCPRAIFYRNNRVCEDCMGKKFAWPGVLHACYRGSRAGTAAIAAMQTIHNSLGSWSRKVDHFIALSAFGRQKLIEGGLPAEKISVAPNFVFPDPGVSEEDRKFILFVGRLSEEKGIATMLRAWEQVHQDIPLVIAGRGPSSDIVEEAAQRLEGVTWLGAQTIDNIYSLMGQAAAVLFPSEWYETFGRVAIEAYSRSTPVIASDLGAISELVEDGRTGLLFEPGNADSLANAARAIWNDLHSARQMGIRGRSLFDRHYTVSQHLETIDDIYSQVTGGLRIPRRETGMPT